MLNLICQVGAPMIGSDIRVNTRVKIFSVAFQKGEGEGALILRKVKTKTSLLFFLKKVLENFLLDGP